MRSPEIIEYWNKQKEKAFFKVDKMSEEQAKYCLKNIIEFFVWKNGPNISKIEQQIFYALKI